MLIVGLGGLGCPVSLYLAAAGIGKLSLCDADTVATSNLQRQILYRADDCGELKVACAKKALQALNSEVAINIYSERVSTEVLDDDYSLVVDCTDNLASRHLLNQHCQRHSIPFVSASAIGWEGQLIAFDFAQHRSLCLNCIIDKNAPEPIMNCGNSGVVGPVLGAMGSLQATTVIRMLLGYFKQHGEMQRYDGKAGRWLSLTSAAKAGCVVCAAK